MKTGTIAVDANLNTFVNGAITKSKKYRKNT